MSEGCKRNQAGTTEQAQSFAIKKASLFLSQTGVCWREGERAGMGTDSDQLDQKGM